MGRILAIDYGAKRTGIAVTDTLQLIANALTTVPTHELIKFLESYFAQNSVDCVVIGKPMRMDNTPSENQKNIDAFVNRFKKLYPSMAIEFVDERFTSVLAQRTILDAGIKKKDRRNKALVDEISAVIILQSYMESKRY